ncbi:MAG: hypothetical protein JXA13_16165 [Anaerolineales bacterium]|nr:hypothetical protein [Anaerolineales bacterium]
MRRVHFSKYPPQWRPNMRAFSFLVLISFLEGSGILVWQLASFSEPASRVFLHHSLESWGLITCSLVFLALVLFTQWVVVNNSEWVQKTIDRVDQGGYQGTLIIITTTGLLIAIGANIWLYFNEALKPYYPKLLPVVLLFTATVVQVWGYILVILRKEVGEMITDRLPLPEEKPISPTSKVISLSLIGIYVLYLFIQGLIYLSIREVAIFPDSNSYFYGAGLELSNPEFWSERRPWGILLLYKILGNSRIAIDLAQTLVSTAAWALLAWAFSRQIYNQWVKLISTFIILAFSLIPAIQLWNHAAMSDSFSISMMIFLLALLLLLLQQWKWPIFFSVIFCFLMLMSIRESSIYISLLAAMLFLLFGLVRRRYRFFVILAIVISLIFVINHRLSSAYALPRWGYPLAEVITKRIQPNNEYLEYFEAHGMPVNSELLSLRGEWANRNNYAVVNSPGLKHFMNWLFDKGPEVYVNFLLAHPRYTITSPVNDIAALIAGYATSSSLTQYPPVIPFLAVEFLYPSAWVNVYLWITLVAVAAFILTHLRTKRHSFWVLVFFFLLAIPHLYLVWHGDAHSVQRHAVVANIQFRIGAWLLFILYIDTHLSGKAV